MVENQARQPRDGDALKQVGIIIFDGVVLADIVGAAEVFVAGDKMISSVFMGSTSYRISLLSMSGGMVMSSSAVQVMTTALPPADQHRFDSLIIASGSGNFDAYRDPRLIKWLQDAHGTVRRTAALCTGVFVLGAAGLLQNKRATTHWALQEKLQREFPQIIVEQGTSITQDGNIYTASDAGLGGEVALCMLEEDLGSALAKRVAQSLVTRPHLHERSSHSHIEAVPHRSEGALRSGRIQKAMKWLEEHMASPISMVDVANVVSMSERNLQREFKRETGQTPHSFLLKVRLDAVCKYLRDTDLPVEKIARRCGFFSGEHVSKLFRKHLGTSPCEYRKNERASHMPVATPSTQRYEAVACCRSDL